MYVDDEINHHVFMSCVCISLYYLIFTVYIAVRHYFGMYILGDSESIRCTIPRATTIEWLHDGAVVESGTGTQLTIRLSINDSIHHNVYACRGYSNFTIVGGFNFTTIVNGMCVCSVTQ